MSLTLFFGGFAPLAAIIAAFSPRFPRPDAAAPISDDLLKLLEGFAFLAAGFIVYFAGTVVTLLLLKGMIPRVVLRRAFVPDPAAQWMVRLYGRVFDAVVPERPS